MGKTAFSGPVYGAKSLLWNYARSSTIPPSTATYTAAQMVVPAGQDWMVTDFHAFRESTHSTAFVVTLVDDSSRAAASSAAVANLAFTSSLAGAVGSTVVAADAGEYEGRRVAAGSTLTLTVGSGNSSVTSSPFAAWAYGYIRFINSTRAEA